VRPFVGLVGGTVSRCPHALCLDTPCPPPSGHPLARISTTVAAEPRASPPRLSNGRQPGRDAESHDQHDAPQHRPMPIGELHPNCFENALERFHPHRGPRRAPRAPERHGGRCESPLAELRRTPPRRNAAPTPAVAMITPSSRPLTTRPGSGRSTDLELGAVDPLDRFRASLRPVRPGRSTSEGEQGRCPPLLAFALPSAAQPPQFNFNSTALLTRLTVRSGWKTR
jgi:hypothetical protein